MFGLQAKLILAAVVVAIIGGLLWRDKIVTKQRNEARAENAVLVASLKTERENTRKANEASAKYQKDLTELRSARASDPLPAVVCKRAKILPAPSTTPARSDAARPADNPPEDEGDRDIGPQLDDFATACEANLIQLTRLQEWIRAR